MNNVIKYMEKIIKPINFWAHRISMVLIFGMMTLTCIDVTGRMFSRPVAGSFELTELMLALIVFLSFGYTQIKKGHISVSVIVSKFPPRIQSVVDMLVYLIIFIALVLMTWQTFVYAMRIKNEVTLDLNLPIYVFVIIVGIGILLFALTIVLDFIKSVARVVNYDHES